jgi:hypothetical protein
MYTNVKNKKSQKPDTKGVIMSPQLNIEPSDYIIPILHLLIGLVNKARISLIHFFDEFVDNISIKEATVNHNMAYLECDESDEANETYISACEGLKILCIIFWKIPKYRSSIFMVD